MIQKYNVSLKNSNKKVKYKEFNIFAIHTLDNDNVEFLNEQKVLGVPTLYFILAGGGLVEYKESRDPEKIFNDLLAFR